MRVIRNLSVRIPWHNERPSACRRSYRARRYNPNHQRTPRDTRRKENLPDARDKPLRGNQRSAISPRKAFFLSDET